MATLSTESANDMMLLESIRKGVKICNTISKKKFRVCVRGRKPFIKEYTNNIWSGRSKSLVSYDIGGNIVGGLKNASVYDVYIYERRS